MREKLTSTEAEGSTANDVDEMLSGCVSKKSLVVSGGKCARRGNNAYGEGTSQLNMTDEIQAMIEKNNFELQAQLSAKIDDEISKSREYDTKLKDAQEHIESQNVVIREQESVILSLQKDVADLKSDLNGIYRVLFQKQASGSGKLISLLSMKFTNYLCAYGGSVFHYDFIKIECFAGPSN